LGTRNVTQVPRLEKAIIDQTWQKKGGGRRRRKEGRGGEERGQAGITFTCPEPGLLVQ
jgi:hypothetical protein